jgi:hypothetical protein
MIAKFALGQVISTSGVVATFDPFVTAACLARHASGDWGDLDNEDKRSNDSALRDGGRIFSSYKLTEGKLYIITEADRSATTFLLPDEY